MRVLDWGPGAGSDILKTEDWGEGTGPGSKAEGAAERARQTWTHGHALAHTHDLDAWGPDGGLPWTAEVRRTEKKSDEYQATEARESPTNAKISPTNFAVNRTN